MNLFAKIALSAMLSIAGERVLAQKTQPTSALPLIGFLSYVSPGEPTSCLDRLKQGMRSHGWLEDRHYRVEIRYADRDELKLPGTAVALVKLKPSVLVSGGIQPIQALRNETKTIPIVTFGSGNMIKTGLVQSLAKPGGNLTGLSNSEGEHSLKPFEMLLRAFPDARDVAVLINPSNPGLASAQPLLWELAKLRGVRLHDFAAGTPAQIDAAYRALAERGIRYAYIRPDWLTFAEEHGRNAERYKIAVVSYQRQVALRGGALSYGLLNNAGCAEAARYVDAIFKGARPEDLPVEEKTQFGLVLNLKTFARLGLAVPRELLLRADEVIE